MWNICTSLRTDKNRNTIYNLFLYNTKEIHEPPTSTYPFPICSDF